MKKLMIYGAAGYTGGMVAEHAASAGLDLVLAGREKDRRALDALAGRLCADVRIFSLDDTYAIDMGLEGISVLLNSAGPFTNTAASLLLQSVPACITSISLPNSTLIGKRWRSTGKPVLCV